jgi:heptaprenyl diphosphate synthase
VAVFSLVDAQMGEVDRTLAEVLRGDNRLMADVSDHLLKASGKRLRPALVLLAGTFGDAMPDRLTRVATAVELIHMATLVHDDIIDDASLRRGLASARHRFGDAVAVLAGDFLFAKAFQLFASVNDPRVVNEAAEVVGIMCSGEIQQQLDHGRVSTEAEYFARIEAKTARFIESSCRLGAMAAGLSREDENRLARFGHEIGMAFQVVDDLLDWSEDASVLGKSVGEDVSQGVFTLPVIRGLGLAETGAVLEKYLGQSGPVPVDTIRELLLESGALSYARSVAEAYVQSAKDALAGFSPSAGRSALEGLAGFVLARDH